MESSNGKVVKAVPAVVLFAQLFAVQIDKQAETTRLNGFKKLVGSLSQEEVKQALRSKKSDEKLAPFVVTLMSLRKMGEQSARQRHGELRTIFQAYMDGFPLGKQTLFPNCLQSARDYIKAKAVERKAHAQDVEHGTLSAQFIREGMSRDDAYTAADAAISAKVAEKARPDVVKIGQGLIDKYGLADSLAIAEWVTGIVRNINKANKAAVIAMVAAPKAEEQAIVEPVAAQA